MFSQRLRLLTAAAISMWLLVLSGVTLGHDIAEHHVEAQQKSDIVRAFDRSDHLRGHAIRVSVHEGQATLGGKVGRAISGQLATQFALGVAGVRSVDNRLTVEPGYRAPRASGKRNYAEVAAQQAHPGVSLPGGDASGQSSRFADAWLTTKVKTTFYYVDNIASDSISVSTRNRVVFLSGSVADSAEHALAIAQAGNITGVRGVVATDYVLVDRAGRGGR